MRSQSIIIINQRRTQLPVGIEPWGDCISIPPGSECIIEGNAGEAVSLEVHDDLVSISLDTLNHVTVDGVRVR